MHIDICTSIVSTAHSAQELRKQIEQFHGCIILTAQETPETSRKLREDLYKKTMSADGIAGRKPYGIATRMLKLVGWKRIEVNRMMSFVGVHERSFPSIFRRSFVWKPQARFLDAVYLREHYPNHANDGVFVKNPELKAFLAAGPTVVAGLRLQHGFESKFSRHECETMIEEYAGLGGDDWLTEDTMRLACGVPLRNRRAADEAQHDAILAPESQEVRDAFMVGMRSVAATIIDKCLSDSKESFTLGMFKYLTLPGDAPNLDKDRVWKNLQDYRLMVPVVIEGRKGRDAVRPVITTKHALNRVADVEIPRHALLTFPEVYDMAALSEYLNGNPNRFLNSQLLMKYYNDFISILKKKKGKKSKPEQATLDEVQHLADKYEAGERVASTIGKKLADKSTEPEAGHTKRRRSVKAPSEEFHPTLSVSVPYHYTLGTVMRTRRQSQHPSAQTCSRRVLHHVARNTVDLDIENCMFTIIAQLVEKLGVQMPGELETTLKLCAHERARVCTEMLRCDLTTGKQVLTATMNGASIPPRWEKNEVLLAVQKLARYMRWLACSLLPDVYENCRSDPERRFPEASTLFFLWSAVEDQILESWLGYVMEHSMDHVSLHYDGLRVRGDIATDMNAFCQLCSERINKETGYRVRIREKTHHYFRDILAKKARSCEQVYDIDEVLLRPGNCIVAAISHCVEDSTQLLEKLRDASDAANVAAVSRRARTYKQAAKIACVDLLPQQGIRIEAPGDYLLHTEGDGCPHCVFVHVSSGEPASAVVRDATSRWLIDLRDLRACAGEGMDAPTIVSYRVLPKGNTYESESTIPQNVQDILLDLLAGAASESDMEDDITSDHEVNEDCPNADDDEAVVHVGDELLSLLRREVATTVKCIARRAYQGENGDFPCPLCPFRRFDRKKRLQHHLDAYHSSRTQFVASGTKQLKAITVLFDDDRLTGEPALMLQTRTAAIMRQTIAPPLQGSVNLIDRSIRLVYTERGPEFHNREALENSREHRRVRNTYYTHGFAEIFRVECLVQHARVKSCLPRLIMIAKQQGNQLAGLYSLRVATWWPFVEDVFTSLQSQIFRQSLARAFVLHEEFESISVDATLKVCTTILGQASYRARPEVRNAAAFGDSESMRRLLTVRGRTGCVLSLEPLTSEGSPEVSMALQTSLPAEARPQVKYIACDNPTPVLWHHLVDVFPNLHIMSLDPVHLAIIYEYATWRKRTAGSSLLRRVMSKLTSCDDAMSAATWGPPYTGAASIQLNRQEEIVRSQILDQSMSMARAKAIDAELDTSRPFYDRIELIEGIAAVCALYPDEVRRKVQSANKEIFKLLWSLV